MELREGEQTFQLVDYGLDLVLKPVLHLLERADLVLAVIPADVGRIDVFAGIQTVESDVVCIGGDAEVHRDGDGVVEHSFPFPFLYIRKRRMLVQ